MPASDAPAVNQPVDIPLAPAVDRAAQLLELIEQADRPVALADAARQLKANKSSVRTILETLRLHQLVERDDETKRYRLGSRLIALGTAALKGRLDLAAVSTPHLTRLAERSKQCCSILVRQGDMALFVQQVDAGHSVGVSIPPGWRIPIFGGAAGKVFAAYLSPAEFSRLLGDLPKFTNRTIADADQLSREVDLVRTRGFATSDQEYFEGVRAVAAPVFGLNRELAAVVHLRGLTGLLPTKDLERLGPEVVATAAAISASLGGRLEAMAHAPSRV